MATKTHVQKVFENLYENDLIAMEITLKEMTNILNKMKKIDSTDKENVGYQVKLMVFESEKFCSVLEALQRQMNDLF